MDATEAAHRTHAALEPVFAGLTPEHREMSTPCAEFTVHDLIGHMCGGAHMIAGGLQGQAPPEGEQDFLSEGPVKGWNAATEALMNAATPEALAANHHMPFGEVPGEVALSVITADHLVHAWDLAKATGQEIEIGDDLAEWGLQTWQMVLPVDGRDGKNFADVVPVSESASAVDRLAGYTGRQP